MPILMLWGDGTGHVADPDVKKEYFGFESLADLHEKLVGDSFDESQKGIRTIGSIDTSDFSPTSKDI